MSEIKVPEIIKSRVARFPLLQMYSGPPSVMRDPSGIRKDKYNLGYRMLEMLNPKAPKMPYIGQQSYAMAAVKDGWYFKSGCCASIKTTGSNTRLVYYIPHVGPMSLKKKIAYINELSKLFNGRLKFLSVATGPTLKHPLTPTVPEGRIAISLNDIGVMQHPRSPVAVTKYITVYGKVFKDYDRLLYLQFLRPLYQTVPIWYHHELVNSSTSNLVSVEYYQPLLFNRITKWFPDLPLVYRMFLSFTLHGRDISSTYFPYYTYKLGCKEKFDLNKYDTILNLLGNTKSIRTGLLYNTGNIEAIKSLNFEGLKFLKDAFPFANNSDYLSYLVKIDTKESFALAIKILATCIEDSRLLELIEPYFKKIKV